MALSRLRAVSAEERVERLLGSLESEGYAVVHNVNTVVGRIDHVVVGPSGVFVLDTKPWRGNIYQAARGRLLCNGQDRSSAINQAIAEAAQIKQQVEPFGIRYVDAIVAITDARVRHPMTFRRVRVTSAEDAVSLIRKAPERLSREQVVRASSAIARPQRSLPARSSTLRRLAR
jgi:hypothetical protein